MACALGMALLPDAEIQRQAGFRPSGTGGAAGSSSAVRSAHGPGHDRMVLPAWLVAQWDMGAARAVDRGGDVGSWG